MADSFKLTRKQVEAQSLAANATHIMAFGGSRSAKTFLWVRAIVIRALAAKMSRHAILRLRFNHVRASIVEDTFPKVMSLCFPEVAHGIDRSAWYCHFPNGSQIWFGGLDEKERVEKVLGNEYATIFLNECSQISWAARNVALTRLAQTCVSEVNGVKKALRLLMLYDCNPPSKLHWTHSLFIDKRDPETRKPVQGSERFASIQINPRDNLENLPPGYLQELEGLPERLRKRFLDGEFADANPNALWTVELIESCRADAKLPDMQRIIVAVDPSGAGDDENAANDSIGIVVAGLGTDGNGYVLEDLTIKAGPAKWGKVATAAYERHGADLVVGESNFGGAMVEFVIKAARPGTPFKLVTASRGKVVRAEPVSVLYEQGKVRHVGEFRDLEGELCAFSTSGYTGEGSPNRADALVWAIAELFPGIAKAAKRETEKVRAYDGPITDGGWMAA